MFRYFAIVWNSRLEAQRRAAQFVTHRIGICGTSWYDGFTCGGLKVFVADSQPRSLTSLALPRNAGVILGTLFRQFVGSEETENSRVLKIEDGEAQLITETRGEQLAKSYWGNYVAFLHDRKSDGTFVIRAPTGSLPCFLTSLFGVTVFFSNIADCLTLNLGEFTINWHYIARHIASGGRYVMASAIKEVTEVHGGQRIELPTRDSPREMRSQFIWNPLQFSLTPNPIEDIDIAAESLRAVVRYCTHALARCHDSILVPLSGGLDSSIILSCLADAPTSPGITSFTCYNRGGRSDERVWARIAADSAGCRNIECELIPAKVRLESLLQQYLAIKPQSTIARVQNGPLESALAARYEATAVFTGDGGDSSFGREALPFVVDEFLARHGIRPIAFRLAAQLAARKDLSIWTVLFDALRTLTIGSTMRDPRESYVTDLKLITPQLGKLAYSSRYYPHPWFDHISNIPWATINRLGTLLLTSYFYDALLQASDIYPETVSPLYAQPVIELCLRIPTYVHFAGGKDRGLARKAFTGRVSNAILTRQWKDRAHGGAEILIDNNVVFLREMLCDGVLAANGLLDRGAVSRALSKTITRTGFTASEILNHLDCEIWVRKWNRAPGNSSTLLGGGASAPMTTDSQ